MKQLGEQKWVAIVAAIAILLSVGAIAWAAVAWTEAKDASDRDGIGVRVLQRDRIESRLDDMKSPTGAIGGGKDRRGMTEDRREQGIQRLVALLDNVRDDMTAQDQEEYEGLMEALKDQRASLRQATQDLTGTLQELRALVAKYLGPGSEGTE